MPNPEAWPAPEQVPAFTDALHLGLVRRVPTSPPALLPQTSARSLGVRLVVVEGVLVLLFILSLMTGSNLLVATAALALGVHTVWAMRTFGERLLDELAHGYVSTTFSNGTFWLNDNRWIAWDFDGVWKWSNGAWVAPTPTGTAPPGLYPSPVEQGRWMVWSGVTWWGRHHAAPRTAASTEA